MQNFTCFVYRRDLLGELETLLRLLRSPEEFLLLLGLEDLDLDLDNLDLDDLLLRSRLLERDLEALLPALIVLGGLGEAECCLLRSFFSSSLSSVASKSSWS